MEWIKVDDRLPKETDKYRVKTDKGITFPCWFIRDCNGGANWGVAAKGRKITHWKPITPPNNQ